MLFINFIFIFFLETAMGATVDAQNKDSAYVRAIGDMRGIHLRRTFSLWKRLDALFIFSQDYRLQKKSLEIIQGFTRSVIEKRKQEKLSKTSEKVLQEDDFGRKKRMAFLDLLLESKIDGRNWTEEEIREEVDTFMFEVKLFICFLDIIDCKPVKVSLHSIIFKMF